MRSDLGVFRVGAQLTGASGVPEKRCEHSDPRRTIRIVDGKDGPEKLNLCRECAKATTHYVNHGTTRGRAFMDELQKRAAIGDGVATWPGGDKQMRNW